MSRFVHKLWKHNILEDQPIHVGMDFNVRHMAGIVLAYFGNVLCAVDEFTDYMDTPDICNAINEQYKNGIRKIIAYPDAAGKSTHSTNASESDHAIIARHKMILRVNPSNPSVKDRVSAVNNAFEKGLLLVDTQACPVLTEALEQQVYDKNGRPDKSTGADHPLDALGYPVVYLHPVKHNRISLVKVAS